KSGGYHILRDNNKNSCGLYFKEKSNFMRRLGDNRLRVFVLFEFKYVKVVAAKVTHLEVYCKRHTCCVWCRPTSLVVRRTTLVGKDNRW
ncbi:unnamed protein product, partial [Microthlaspi erraticum]